jgi:hypothetical protein
MEDAEGTLARAGIHEGGAQPRLKRVRGFTCEVCYNDETQETLALSCDHRCKLFPCSLSPLNHYNGKTETSMSPSSLSRLQGLLLAVPHEQDHGRERVAADRVHGQGLQRHCRRADSRTRRRAQRPATVRRASGPSVSCGLELINKSLALVKQVPNSAEPHLRRRQPSHALVPRPELRIRDPLRRRDALPRRHRPDRPVRVRSRLLLRLLARRRSPTVLLPDRQALVAKVQGRLGDEQLDLGQHERVHKVPLDDREEWRVQRESTASLEQRSAGRATKSVPDRRKVPNLPCDLCST